MPNEPESGHHERDKSSEPRQTEIERIVASLDRLCDEYVRDNKQQSAHDQHKTNREIWTVRLICLYTVITAVIMIIGISQAIISRNSEHRQLRAYVGPIFNGFKLTNKLVDCEPSTSPTEIFPHLIFCFRYKNYGLTPARFPHICGNFYAGGPNEVKRYILSHCAPNPTPTSPTIWPGEERHASEPNPDKAQLSTIMVNNRGSFFIEITYDDIFGEPHFTDICRTLTRDFPGSEFHIGACRIGEQQDD